MQILELFEKILSFRSITPDDAGAFEFIEDYLSEFDVIKLDIEGVKNRFFYKKFGDGEHLCFAGHIDVVPSGEGWSSDPFTPTRKDGFIYARGAQDMKSGLSAFLKASKDLKEFNGTLSLLLTSDEEGVAKFGTIKMLEHLKEIDFLPDFAIVAEPTCEDIFGDAIKIGRRGSINGVIEKIGVQGHAAYPEKSKNPIHKVATILPDMAGAFLDEGDDDFAPSQFVITDIRAGMEVTNVTPASLKMMFNIRNSTKTTIEDVKEFIDNYFKDMDYTLSLDQSAKPFVTKRDSKVVSVISQAIIDIVDITPKLSTAGGTSDARFFGEFGVDTVEFGVKNDTIHAIDERVGIKEVEDLYRVFVRVLEIF
jgi:succinyl-diaminopimelate desuccinylase